MLKGETGKVLGNPPSVLFCFMSGEGSLQDSLEISVGLPSGQLGQAKLQSE